MANEVGVIMAITVEEEAITVVVETKEANMVARKAATLVVARKTTKGILTLIQTSTVRCMQDKDMMWSTAIKLHMTKSKKNKAAMDLKSQIAHINQALNTTKCPHL